MPLLRKNTKTKELPVRKPPVWRARLRTKRAKPGQRALEAVRFYQGKVCPTLSLLCQTHVRRFAKLWLELNGQQITDSFYTSSPRGTSKNVQAKFTATALELLATRTEDGIGKLITAAQTIAFSRTNQTLQLKDLKSARAILSAETVSAKKNERGRVQLLTEDRKDPSSWWAPNSKQTLPGSKISEELREVKFPSDADLKKVLRRNGVVRVSAKVFPALRAAFKDSAANLLSAADALRDHARKRIISRTHVQNAYKKVIAA
ncbi:unnamed protein product [Amoebophrya sp. A25]|nr:unnamed protein product [Amoebophrya sp. A25]|eukprot:GSA25T00000660001.1